MNTKIKIILIGVVLLVIAIIFIVVRNGNNDNDATNEGPTEVPIDVVLEFYDSWLDILRATSTDPYQSELLASVVVSSDVRSAINSARIENPDLDPVTCQTGQTPENFRARIFPTSETETKILIESKVAKETQPMMSFVTLTVVDNKWQITNIECTQGDVAPDVEFTYDRQGLLLKSVPPPYEAGKWHLVFEQDGQMGYVTPLFFSATTSCVSKEGVTSVCNPDAFTETDRVSVKGGMTELGAEVVRIEFLD